MRIKPFLLLLLFLITFQVFELSGERNPYKKGKLGEISGSAYADIIIVDGNPMKNIDLLTSPEKNFVLIIKDGVIYKNTLVK